MSSLLLLVLCCYVFGLSIGLCCSVSAGAGWLLAAVYLTALLSWAVSTLVAVLFLAGSTLNNILCDSLKNPNQTETVFRYLDGWIHSEIKFPNDTDGEVLTEMLLKANPVCPLYSFVLATNNRWLFLWCIQCPLSSKRRTNTNDKRF